MPRLSLQHSSFFFHHAAHGSDKPPFLPSRRLAIEQRHRELSRARFDLLVFAPVNRTTKPTKARILHVDDHQDTRLMMATLLGDGGYGVMTVGTLAEAVALARETTFDLFLLDVRLPDGTGVELCQQLRALRPGTPVLYYSAYGYESAHQAALATCGDAYLRKPVVIEEIESAIARLLARRP